MINVSYLIEILLLFMKKQFKIYQISNLYFFMLNYQPKGFFKDLRYYGDPYPGYSAALHYLASKNCSKFLSNCCFNFNFF